MNTRRTHTRRWAAASLLSALLLALPVNRRQPARANASSRTAVVGLDLEPPCLNVLLDDCNFVVANTVTSTTLAGAFRVRPDFSFEPVLVDRVDVQSQPFALTYHIKRKAVWSDGTPVTADDFIFTVETILDPSNNTLRAGYERIVESVKVNARTVRFRFSAPNPDWRSLFPYVLPKHVLAGHDFDQVWRDEIADPVTHEPIGSGPFLLTGRTSGQSLTVTRNPRWWGQRPSLESIEFRIVPSLNDQFQGIRNGTIDLITPQAQTWIADIRSVEGVAVQSAPGTAMEHLDFNVGSATMPLLRETWFRQAVVYAIDRAAVAAASFDTLVPNYPALHNLSFSSIEAGYEPVFAHYVYSPQTVAGLMVAHGCARGADGIWSCGGVRASVRFATTTGNVQRELVQQLMVAQARAAGIELVPDNSPGGVLFGTRLPNAAVRADHVHVGSRCEPAVGAGAVRLWRRAATSWATARRLSPILRLRAEVELDPTVRALLDQRREQDPRRRRAVGPAVHAADVPRPQDDPSRPRGQSGRLRHLERRDLAGQGTLRAAAGARGSARPRSTRFGSVLQRWTQSTTYS